MFSCLEYCIPISSPLFSSKTTARMASNNDNNADKWQYERNDAQGSPWDSIRIEKVPRFFPDSVYEQATYERAQALPSLEPISTPHVSTVSGLFEVNGRLRRVWSPPSTPVESSSLNLDQSTSPTLPPSTFTSAPTIRPATPPHGFAINSGESYRNQQLMDPLGTSTTSYPEPPSPFSQFVITNTATHQDTQATQQPTSPFIARAEYHIPIHPGPHDYSRPNTLFNERVPTPPPPPPSPIDPWECLDALKIVAFQCSPSDEGNDEPISHTNRLLHGKNPRFCLKPANYAERQEGGLSLSQILDFGARIFASRRKIKSLFVDKTIRIPMEIEDFIQELGESAGKGRNDVPLQEAVEDLENYLKTVSPTKRPQVYSSTQILIAITQLFTRAMTEANEKYEAARRNSYYQREITQASDTFTDSKDTLKHIKEIQDKVIRMYKVENEGPFLVIDFETVECFLCDLDGMEFLARRRRWNYPRAEILGEEEMRMFLERWKGLAREVVRIEIKRGVKEEDYDCYLASWLSMELYSEGIW